MTDYVPMDREEVEKHRDIWRLIDVLGETVLELEARIDALECWRDKDETPSPR